MSIINVFDFPSDNPFEIEGIEPTTLKVVKGATLKFFNSNEIPLLQKIILHNIIDYTPNNILKSGISYEIMGETFESSGFISDMFSIVYTVHEIYHLGDSSIISSDNANKLFLKLLFDDTFIDDGYGIQRYIDVVHSADGYVEIYDDIDGNGNLHHSSTSIPELLKFINSIFESCVKKFTGSCDDWFPYVRSRLIETARPELRLNNVLLAIIEDSNSVTDVDLFSYMVNLCNGRGSWFYDHQINTSCIIIREQLADMKAISKIFGNNYYHIDSRKSIPSKFSCDLLIQISALNEELIACELLESNNELRYNLVSSETTNNLSNVVLISYEFLEHETKNVK